MGSVNFARLEQNVCDVIKEEQIKLGYKKEAIRLFYPLQSLNRFLGTGLPAEEMQQALQTFCDSVENKLGRTEVAHEGERFCFFFSPEAAEYIDTHTEHQGFLYDFIHTIGGHHVTIEEVVRQFQKYSEHVHVERVTHGEFDYLIYFEDGVPDAFRYCLTDEGCHMIYHRFTIEDYEDFRF